MIRGHIRKIKGGTRWEASDGRLYVECSTWHEARAWLYQRMTSRCATAGCDMQRLPHEGTCREHLQCQFEDCQETAEPMSILAMCHTHDAESTALLRRQVEDKHRRFTVNNRIPHWYETTSPEQTLTPDDLRRVQIVVDRMTPEERARMTHPTRPILPVYARQRALGIGLKETTYLTPKVWAYLTGRHTVGAAA